MELLIEEVDFCRKYQNGEANKRNFYELDQMTQSELERYQTMKIDKFSKRKAEQSNLLQKQQNYIRFATDEIMSRARDLGVTIFMPHVVNKNLFKNVVNVGDKLKLSAKDKATVKITSANLKIINFEKEDFPKILFDFLKGKEAFAVCWKLSDDELRSTEGMICCISIYCFTKIHYFTYRSDGHPQRYAHRKRTRNDKSSSRK